MREDDKRFVTLMSVFILMFMGSQFFSKVTLKDGISLVIIIFYVVTLFIFVSLRIKKTKNENLDHGIKVKLIWYKFYFSLIGFLGISGLIYLVFNGISIDPLLRIGQ